MPAELHGTLPPKIIYERSPAAHSSEDQCDCACVIDAGAVMPAPVLELDTHYELRQPVSILPITRDHSMVMNDCSPIPAVLNRSALDVARFFDQPRRVADTPPDWNNMWGAETVRHSLQQLVSLGLLAATDEARLPLVEAAPITLSAWLHVTDRCNMRCAYCYLPHEPLDMSPETARAAIDATFRAATRNHYRRVKLKFAGGEPLLRFTEVVDWYDYARQQADHYNLAMDGVVLSNGTLLTNDMIDTMLAHRLRLMISLDGLGQVHNQHRVYASGRGSADDVQHAIERALAHNLVPDISVTISSRTAHGLPPLMAWLVAHKLPFSLNFYRENDFSAAQQDLRLEDDKIIRGMLAAFEVIEAEMPQQSLLASLVDKANLAAPHLRPCSVGHSYLVFEPHGNLARCQMQISQTIGDVSAPDPLSLIRDNKRGLQNPPVQSKAGCEACEWRFWCAGGCPLETFRVTGRYDVRSPNCRIYQTLFPAVLRLEGLRLLKYNTSPARE
jgi:uncharacterized protein